MRLGFMKPYDLVRSEVMQHLVTIEKLKGCALQRRAP